MAGSDKPVLVGVHLFGGGAAWGMEQAGFQVPMSLEESDYAADTFRLNMPHVELVQSMDQWGRARALQPRVLFGHPACSCWSAIGRGASRWRSHPALSQTISHVAFGLAVRPDVWVTESVPPFQKEAAPAFASLWREEGYAVSMVRVDAKALGLPQQRRRVFLVAHRVDIDWQPPLFEGAVPVGMALEGVPVRESETWPHLKEYEWLLDRTAPGERLVDQITDEYPGTRRPRALEFRLPYDRVTGTLVAQSVYYHPYENRMISWREYAALSGYPPTWEMPENTLPYHAIEYMGKAVLPPVAAWLGGQLLRALDQGAPPRREATVATFWAGNRLNDFNFKNTVEDWDIPAVDDELLDRVTSVRRVYKDWRL